MAQTTIWKPSTINSWKGGIAFLADQTGPRTPPTVTLPDGRVITGKYVNTNEGRHQWTFPQELAGMKDIKISYNGQTGTIADGATSYEGGGLTSWQPRAKGSLGDMSGGFGGAGISGSPTVGGFGAVPQFIGDQFPTAAQSTYDPIPGAAKDYKYVDPIKFGKEFTPYQREELAKNMQQAKGFALDQIDTELEGLFKFVPKSAALKREQTAEDNAQFRRDVALDNPFNQAQRTTQVNQAVPDVVADLNRVAGDARIYASGEVPNSVIDNALTIGTNSASADVAAASGFGVRSSAARKVSDLMSARERIGLSQYGQGLLSDNARQRTDLLLAPTEYATSQQSNAGQQINAAPTLSGSQLQGASFETLNNNLNIRSETAFQNVTQQSQFITNLQQATQQFNASNTLQNDQFNVTNLNNFALSYFNYLNSYVNAVAGATQTAINTGIALDQQDTAREVADENKKDTQENNEAAIDTELDILGGGVVAGPFSTVVSDLRLKDGVENYSTGLEDVSKLNVVKYKYKRGTVADDGGKNHIGLVAQELAKVFPEAVGKHSSGYYQIDPAELIYSLISAVQVLTKRVTDLEAK